MSQISPQAANDLHQTIRQIKKSQELRDVLHKAVDEMSEEERQMVSKTVCQTIDLSRLVDRPKHESNFCGIFMWVPGFFWMWSTWANSNATKWESIAFWTPIHGIWTGIQLAVIYILIFHLLVG